jgi:AraC-like DNA-binding protein
MNIWLQKDSEALIEEQHEQCCAAAEGLSERRVDVHLPQGTARIHEWSFDGIEIRTTTAELHAETILHIQETLPRITLHFATRERSEGRYDRLDRQICYTSFEHNIMATPFVCGQVRFAPAERLNVCEIRFAPEYFARLLPENSTLFTELRRAIEQGNATVLGKTNFSLTPQMEGILRDIQTPARRGCLQKLYLEAKVLELFVVQTEHIERQTDACTRCGLCMNDFSGGLGTSARSERERLQDAFEIIQASFAHPPTLVELARKVGLNEFKLKRGFKQTFGTTVYGLVLRERMNKARELLLAGDTQHPISITDIAEAVGYQHATHFTAAFKKHFGELPSTMRSIG